MFENRDHRRQESPDIYTYLQGSNGDQMMTDDKKVIGERNKYGLRNNYFIYKALLA